MNERFWPWCTVSDIGVSGTTRSFTAPWDTLTMICERNGLTVPPKLQLTQPDMNSWMKTPNRPSGVVTPWMKCWDVIEPICLRGLFSVLNINGPNCIKAQHYSRIITSTTTKTIQPKCGQEQLTLPLFGNYVTIFCLCSRNLDKVFTLAKQTHFYRVRKKRACTIGHHWHMQYCTSIWEHFEGFFFLFF